MLHGSFEREVRKNMINRPADMQVREGGGGVKLDMASRVGEVFPFFFFKSLWKPGLIGSKLFSPIWACCGHDSNLVSDLPVLIPPHELFDLTSSPVLLMRKVRTWVKGAAGS